MTECTECKGSTVSDPGSSTCRCTGLNRIYLKESNDCICERGYTPVDASEALADGFSDCQ